MLPHLLVRRPARSHSWSNVTDRVLESSTRLYVYFLALRATAVRIRSGLIESLYAKCQQIQLYDD